MANTLAPFGFRHIGYMEGFAPSAGTRHRKIRLGNANPIFHGDPVVTGTGSDQGYIIQAATNTPTDTAASPAPTVGGVFVGCEYVSVSQGRKIRSPYWPGSDAAFDPDAFIIDTAGALFLAQSNGAAIVFANVGNNVGMFIATGGSAAPTAGSGQGNTSNGLSGALLDVAGTNGGGSGAIATGAALPFKIYALYSDSVVQGAPNAGGSIVNGADNTTNFNWAVITMNLSETRRGTLGI
jgi:hypothetical protein